MVYPTDTPIRCTVMHPVPNAPAIRLIYSARIGDLRIALQRFDRVVNVPGLRMRMFVIMASVEGDSVRAEALINPNGNNKTSKNKTLCNKASHLRHRLVDDDRKGNLELHHLNNNGIPIGTIKLDEAVLISIPVVLHIDSGAIVNVRNSFLFKIVQQHVVYAVDGDNRILCRHFEVKLVQKSPKSCIFSIQSSGTSIY